MPETEAGEWTLAADTWARTLAGLSGEQIGVGLEACRVAVDDYLPTAAQFRAQAIEQQRRTQSATDAQNATRRFIGTGSIYTPR